MKGEEAKRMERMTLVPRLGRESGVGVALPARRAA